MDVNGTVAILGAATALTVSITGVISAVAALKGLHVARDVQVKVNGMQANKDARAAQLTDVIVDAGIVVPPDPNVVRPAVG